MQSLAKAQGEEEYFDKTRATDEKQFRLMVKAATRAKEASAKERKKLKWSFHTFREEFIAVNGKKVADIDKMMWEGEFNEWCATAAGGYLSRQEATEWWEELKGNKKVARDQRGPRQRMRLAVPVSTEIQKYRDLQHTRGVGRESKLGKKMTEKQWDTKIQQLVSSLTCNEHVCVMLCSCSVRIAQIPSHWSS